MAKMTKYIDMPVVCRQRDCERCGERVKDALAGVKGIESAKVDTQDYRMRLEYDPNVLSHDVLRRKTVEAGCVVAGNFGHEIVEVNGLDCPDCTLKLEKAVGSLPGVLWVSLSFTAATLAVEFDKNVTDFAKVLAVVRGFGYDIRSDPAEAVAEPFWQTHGEATATAGSASLVVIGYLISLLGPGLADLSAACYIGAVAVGGYRTARKGLYALRSFTLDMNFLVAVAAAGAVALGEYLEAAGVVLLFSLGNTLEARSVRKARDAISSLVNLSPKTATVLVRGEQLVKPLGEVRVGDSILVKPRETVALDGVVSEGESAVDEAVVTGESMPVEKSAGERVLAGTVNGHGSLTIKVERESQDSAVARIIELVSEAQSQKAPTEMVTERFGRLYTPVITLAAVLLAVVPPIAFGEAWHPWLYKSLVMLVVACPCALVISAPVAMVSAIANAARHGILFRGGMFVEALARTKVVAFDKTGTLTIGRPGVTDVCCVKDGDDDRLLAIAAAVESHSEHPLARAIKKYADEKGVPAAKVSKFKAYPGGGVAGIVDGEQYFLGSHRMMNQENLPFREAKERAEAFESQGKTVLFVSSRQELLGVIAVADRQRQEAAGTVEGLRAAGVSGVYMLTGDNIATAKSMSASLGLNGYYAELLPQEKVSVVAKLEGRHGAVAMVGDGINDTPALARASVGVAMGAAGSEAALQAADVALMGDDLEVLVDAMHLGKRTMRTVAQNIAFSVAVVVALIMATVVGRLSLAMGVVGHEVSALLVIANGLRLLNFPWRDS